VHDETEYHTRDEDRAEREPPCDVSQQPPPWPLLLPLPPALPASGGIGAVTVSATSIIAELVWLVATIV
jgi:hypothetical protein